MDWLSIFSAIGGLAGIGSLFSVVLYFKPNQRKINAEAKQIEAAATDQSVDTAFKLISKLEKRQDISDEKIKLLEKDSKNIKGRLEKAMARIEVLMQGITDLISQLKAHDITPCWEPDEWSDE